MKRTDNIHRNIIIAQGEDVISFLQGLLTNDINKIINKNVVYTALLSPQGKYLYDFFISYYNEKVYIECNVEETNDIKNIFSKYILRKNITLVIHDDLIALPILNKNLSKTISLKDGLKRLTLNKNLLFYTDPRNIEMGARIIGNKKEIYEFMNFNILDDSLKNKYNEKRIELCIPEPYLDLEKNKSFILEYNFEQINAVSFTKGCYVGQENTARLKHRGNIKRELQKVKLIEGTMPEIDDVLYIDDNEVGVMKSSYKNMGLAIIKKNYIKVDSKLKSKGSLLKIKT